MKMMEDEEWRIGVDGWIDDMREGCKVGVMM